MSPKIRPWGTGVAQCLCVSKLMLIRLLVREEIMGPSSDSWKNLRSSSEIRTKPHFYVQCLFCRVWESFSLHCNLNSPPLNLQLHWNNCWWQQTSLNHSDTTRALCWSYCSINGLLWESARTWGCMMQIKMRNRTATGNLFPITTFNKSSCLCTCRTGTICLSWLRVWIHAPTEKHALEQPTLLYMTCQLPSVWRGWVRDTR